MVILEAQRRNGDDWVSDPTVIEGGVQLPTTPVTGVRWLYQDRIGDTGYGAHEPIPPAGPPLRVLVADFEG